MPFPAAWLSERLVIQTSRRPDAERPARRITADTTSHGRPTRTSVWGVVDSALRCWRWPLPPRRRPPPPWTRSSSRPPRPQRSRDVPRPRPQPAPCAARVARARRQGAAPDPAASAPAASRAAASCASVGGSSRRARSSATRARLCGLWVRRWLAHVGEAHGRRRHAGARDAASRRARTRPPTRARRRSASARARSGRPSSAASTRSTGARAGRRSPTPRCPRATTPSASARVTATATWTRRPRPATGPSLGTGTEEPAVADGRDPAPAGRGRALARRRATRTRFCSTTSPAPNGVITNHYAFWSPDDTTAFRDDVWEMESGCALRRDNMLWTGVPTSNLPNKDCSNGSGSQVFRLWTKRSFTRRERHVLAPQQRLRRRGPRASAAGTAIKIWLRRQGGTGSVGLYTAEVNRRQGNIMIQKKCAGSDVYHILNQGRPEGSAASIGEWEQVGGSIVNQPNGSVKITLMRHGADRARGDRRRRRLRPVQDRRPCGHPRRLRELQRRRLPRGPGRLAVPPSYAGMTAVAIRLPDRAIVPLSCGAAVVFGALVAVKPFAALGLLAFAGIVTVAFVWPVAHLTPILAVTSIVPWAIQNQYGFGGGAGPRALRRAHPDRPPARPHDPDPTAATAPAHARDGGDRGDALDRRPPGRARMEVRRGPGPGGLRVPRPARLVDDRDRDPAACRPRTAHAAVQGDARRRHRRRHLRAASVLRAAHVLRRRPGGPARGRAVHLRAARARSRAACSRSRCAC